MNRKNLAILAWTVVFWAIVTLTIYYCLRPEVIK